MRSKLRAVSLLETLIAIALVAGLMGLTIPSVFRQASAGLPHTIRQLVSLVDQLRYKSITEHLDMQLVFDFEHQLCFILTKSGDTWLRDDEKFPPLELDSGVKLRYFQSGSQLITARLARVNILPIGYIDQFQITMEEGADRIYYKISSIAGKSMTGTDTNLFF